MKRGMLFTCLLAAVVSVVVGIWGQRTQPDPMYQGKRLRAWLNDLDSPSAAQRDKAREAVWTLGTNALGPLPNMLRARHCLPAQILLGLNKFGATRSPVRFHIMMPQDLRRRALAAYGLLGPLASPDVPLLSKMLVEESSAEVRVQAASALHGIKPAGPDSAVAVASLTRATRELDPEVRFASTFALIVIKPEPNLLVPVLVDRLTDPFAPTREIARSSLLSIGNAAVSALRDASQTNQIAGEILRQMHERKLRNLSGETGIRYL